METFLPIEIEFLAEAHILPEEYQAFFLPPLDDGLRIPRQDERVGDMEIKIFRSFIYVKIGAHTEQRIAGTGDAMTYIKDVLTNQVVFYFGEGKVAYFKADEFKNLSEMDGNYFVWSGPLRYAFMERK